MDESVRAAHHLISVSLSPAKLPRVALPLSFKLLLASAQVLLRPPRLLLLCRSRPRSSSDASQPSSAMLSSYDIAATRTQIGHSMMQHNKQQHGGWPRDNEQTRAPTLHSTLLSMQSRHGPQAGERLAAAAPSSLPSSTAPSSLPARASASFPAAAAAVASGAGGSSSSGSDEPDGPDGGDGAGGDGVELPLPLPGPSSAHWQHAVSAMGAGAITAVFTSPFDVIRTRLAVQRSVVSSGSGSGSGNGNGSAAPTQAYNGLIGSFKTIYREEGVRGLFRGFGPTIIVVPSFWAIYFSQSLSHLFAAADQVPASRSV